MNIHSKINYRSQFAHQFQTRGCLIDSEMSKRKGFIGIIDRPHLDRRQFGHRHYQIFGYNPMKIQKFHSYYPKVKQ